MKRNYTSPLLDSGFRRNDVVVGSILPSTPGIPCELASLVRVPLRFTKGRVCVGVYAPLACRFAGHPLVFPLGEGEVAMVVFPSCLFWGV